MKKTKRLVPILLSVVMGVCVVVGAVVAGGAAVTVECPVVLGVITGTLGFIVRLPIMIPTGIANKTSIRQAAIKVGRNHARAGFSVMLLCAAAR